MIVKPNLFIVGAQKCGTTAMHIYLGQHPDIFMSEIKEPHFFSTDLKEPNSITDEKEYLFLFKKANGKKIIGESSVWYLYSENAPENIKRVSPNAKIIIMLRNPVELVYSMHSQALIEGYEDIENFEDALNAEKDRLKELRIPESSYTPYIFYNKATKYAEFVKKYFDIFGRENVQVIIFDDFKKDTSLVYEETCRFLEVDISFKPKFPIINLNKQLKNRYLRDFFEKKTPWPFSLFKKILPLSWRSYLGRIISPIYVNYGKQPPLDEQLRIKLQEKYKFEVEKLSKLLNRDLVSLWCT